LIRVANLNYAGASLICAVYDKCVIAGSAGQKIVDSIFYRCTVHFDIYKVHIQINALFIKLDKISKFTLKTTLTCSYVFRSTTIIREPSLEPN